MRYNDWEQRQMDIKSGLQQDNFMRKTRLAKPCKNKQAEVDPWDGSCLRCGAVQGETCRSIDNQ